MRQRNPIVVGDTPQIVLTITDRTTGKPVDVSGSAVVALKVRAVGATAIKGTVTCTKLPGIELSPGSVDTSAPYDVPGFGGRCLAACPATLFDAAGEYEAEIEVTRGAIVSTAYDLVRFYARSQF